MVPFCPWIRMFGPTVRVPVLSMPMRLFAPVEPRVMVPVPPRVWVPSKVRTLLLLTLIAPFSVSPLVTRSMPVAEARSRLPFRVTPERKLLAVLVATNVPLPAELRFPPTTVTPFKTMTPPTPALSTPPVLVSVPPLKFSVPADIPPACIVPVLVVPPDEMESVLPPLTIRVSVLLMLLMVSVPVRWVMVRRPPTLMTTSSLAPGNKGLLLQLAATSQKPLVSVQLTVAPYAGEQINTPSARSCNSFLEFRPKDFMLFGPFPLRSTRVRLTRDPLLAAWAQPKSRTQRKDHSLLIFAH